MKERRCIKSRLTTFWNQTILSKPNFCICAIVVAMVLATLHIYMIFN